MYRPGPGCSQGCPPQPYSPGGLGGAGWYNNRDFGGVPWWIWLLILGLLLLLLTCLVCIVAGCLLARRRKRTTIQPLPPPPPPTERQVYTIDESAQTLPEMRSTSMQVEHDLAQKRQLQFDDGGIAIPLRNQPPSDTESIQEARTQRVYSRHNYEKEAHGTYPSRRYETIHMNGHLPQQQYQQRTLTDRRAMSRYQQVVRTENSDQHRRLQRELEEEARRKQRNEEYARRIEKHLEEHRRHPYSEPPSGEETFREETVRTMRQSSVI
uniref:Uncharacterized protein n=1 Tax=Acrobeloides nanus TaxID=290746 RepID=A0A914DSK4_9BILA